MKSYNSKKALWGMLTAMVLFLTMTFSLLMPLEVAAETYTRYVNADFLTVRKSNTVNSEALGAFDYGEKITCYGSVGNWVKVMIDGKNGYVYNSYLQKTKPESSPATTDNAYVRYVIADNLNIRKSTSASSLKVGSYKYGDQLTCYGTDGDWTKVICKGVTAYVYTSYLSAKSPAESTLASSNTVASDKTSSTYKMYVSCSDLNVREKASSKSAVLAVYYRGDKVTCCGESGDWTKIKLSDGYGYMFTAYLSESKQAESCDSSSVSGSLVAAYAKKYLGLRYVWGGASLSKGVDCSGFTQQVYKHFGYSLPHSAKSQRSSGFSVAQSNRKPGDLICYNAKNGVYHVGIYLGDDKVIHASGVKTGVKISTWNYRSVNCVRRLIK